MGRTIDTLCAVVSLGQTVMVVLTGRGWFHLGKMTVILRVLRAEKCAHGVRSGRAKRLTEIYDPLILGRSTLCGLNSFLAILYRNTFTPQCALSLAERLVTPVVSGEFPRQGTRARHLSAALGCRHACRTIRRRNKDLRIVATGAAAVRGSFPRCRQTRVDLPAVVWSFCQRSEST